MSQQTDNNADIQSVLRFSDFLCDHSLHDANTPCLSEDHWFYALQAIRESLFSNTSATISAPFYHILDYERKGRGATQTSSVPMIQLAYMEKMASTYNFNAQPFTAKDIYMYRQLRSEHLLIRMAHCIDTEQMTYTIIRLSRGVFLVQKYLPSDPIDFPSRTTFDQSFRVRDEDTVPVDTFSFDTLFNDMMRQTQQVVAEKEEELARSFVPYTYTLGLRYTNPYQDTRDIVVRGKIPLWCQTLFITECMRQLPILPNTTLTNLLPFLKGMEFRFTTIAANNKGYSNPYPELTTIFERFAMELCQPQIIWQNADSHGNKWAEAQEKILNSIVFCDISDEQAFYITSVANQWAMSQGLALQ